MVFPYVNIPRQYIFHVTGITTKNIAKAESLSVNYTVSSVNNAHPQRIIMISDPGIDELQLYPQFVIDFTEKSFVIILCVSDDIAGTEQLSEFLFVKCHATVLR